MKKYYAQAFFAVAILVGAAFIACDDEDHTSAATTFEKMEMDFSYEVSPDLLEVADITFTYTNPAGPMLVVPMTTADTTCTGKVLESLASESHYTLTPAYYDIALKGKYARDTDSAAMLDIIFANRVYDLTQAYGWGTMPTSFRDLAIKGSTDLASLVASRQKTFDSAIEKFVGAFTE